MNTQPCPSGPPGQLQNVRNAGSLPPSYNTPASSKANEATKMTDGVSLADSGYGSQSGSNTSTTVANLGQNHTHSTQSGRRIPGTELFMFKTGGNEETRKHYEDISPAIESLLTREIMDKCPGESSTKILRLAVIGKSQQDCCFWVVVLGTPNLENIVRSFFTSDHISALLDPGRPNVPCLPFIFIPRPPVLRSSLLDIQVCCPNASASKTTFCGSPILLRTHETGTTENQVHQATFGGLIKASFSNGDVQLYGLTAGHAVHEFQRQVATPFSNATVPNSGISGSRLNPVNGEHYGIGHVVDTEKLPRVKTGHVKPSHDWALFSVIEPRPNQATSAEAHRSDGSANHDNDSSGHDILIAEVPTFHDGLSDPVLLLDDTHGTRRGELSNLPARIWIERSKGFVNVYPLELEDSAAASGGSSGAWVVHHATPELYGHVVATDAFGDTYVIPAPESFENIRKCMGAVSVTLPSHNDFRKEKWEGSTVHDAKSNAATESQGTKLSFVKRKSALSHPVRTQTFVRRKTSARQKVWPREFSHERHFHEDEPFVQSLRTISAVCNSTNGYLADAAFGNEPSRIAREIADFCSGLTVQDLIYETSPACCRPSVWLDDRSRVVSLFEHPRVHSFKLTAKQLYETLQNPRYGRSDIADADRRLICISDFDPWHCIVLLETAPYHLFSALKNAIWGHITSQASLTAKVSKRGYLTFCLTFQMPFYAFREGEARRSHARVGQRPGRERVDLAFLDVLGSNRYCAIYETQFSILIFGTDESRWTAYAFIDSAPTYDEPSNSDCEDDRNDETLRVDPICDGSDLFLDADNPIWNPREYFLRIVRCRLSQIRQEWCCLVIEVERGIEIWTDQHRPSMLGHSIHDQPKGKDNHHDRLVWIIQMRGILAKIRLQVQTTLAAWDRFSRRDGDIATLLSDSSPGMQTDAADIKESFNALAEVQQRLNALDRFCTVHAEVLKLYSDREHSLSQSRRHTRDYGNAPNTSAIHSCTDGDMDIIRDANTHPGLAVLSIEITNLVLTPIAISLGYFSTQYPIFSFKRNNTTFFISMCILYIILAAFLLSIRFLVEFKNWSDLWSYLKRAVRKCMRSGPKRLSLDDVVEKGSDESPCPWRV